MAEIVKNNPDIKIAVNVQGDEPLIKPESIDLAIECLKNDNLADISTLIRIIDDEQEKYNPNTVKAVIDNKGFALYFSRAPIPWARDAWMDAWANPAAWMGQGLPPGLPVKRHVGLYAYRVGFLKSYPTLARPPLEAFESLEQLRALWHGHRIVVIETPEASPPGVDTPEDLELVRRLLAQGAVQPGR